VSWSAAKWDITYDDPFCSGVGTPNTRFMVQVEAYDALGRFPLSDGTMRGSDEQALELMLHLVDSSGAEVNPVPSVESLTTGNNRRNAEFLLSLCRADHLNSYSVGFHFLGGNEVCLLVQ
jgi:hypothetical protein